MVSAEDVMGWRIVVQDAKTSRSGSCEADVERDVGALADEAKRLQRMVLLTGRLIDYVAMLIRLCQAPGVDGMLDVRWWVLRGRSSPVLVRWKKLGGGNVVRPVKVERLDEEMVDRVAVPEMRPFLVACLEVWGELEGVWRMLRLRLSRGFEKGYVQRYRFEARLLEVARRLVGVHEGVVAALRARGNVVEERFWVSSVVGQVGQ